MRAAVFILLAAGLTLILAGAGGDGPRSETHSEGGGCGGAGVSSGGDDDDTDLAGYDGQAFIVPTESGEESVVLTLDEMNTLQAETFGDAEDANVVWEVAIDESASTGASLSPLALKAQGFDPSVVGELFECDDDDLVVPGQCGAPPPPPGQGAPATNPSGNPPRFLGPVALGDSWTGQFQRPDGKMLGLRPALLPSKPDIQSGFIYAMPDNCPCDGTPKECHGQGLECVDRKDVTFVSISGFISGGGGEAPLGNKLVESLVPTKVDWDQVTLSFRRVTLPDGTRKEVGIKETSLLDPDTWTWYLFFYDPEKLLGQISFDCVRDDVASLVIPTAGGGSCVIDFSGPPGLRFKNGSFLSPGQAELTDLFESDCFQATDGGVGPAASRFWPAIKTFFNAVGMTGCADSLPDDPSPAGTMSAWWSGCGNEFNNQLTVVQRFGAVEAVWQLAPHLFTLATSALVEANFFEKDSGGFLTHDEAQACLEFVGSAFADEDSFKGSCNSMMLADGTHCHSLSSQGEAICRQYYMKYCDTGGSGFMCPTGGGTVNRYSFHNCSWNEKNSADQKCFSMGSGVDENTCRLGGRKFDLNPGTGCGDAICDVTGGETKNNCGEDCVM